ncbi:hypothetical protein [Pseudidiomarina terrestris]|uniref:hypothetical protein n=1 Tax=Pseudidiomarina terrestris TaxID=2820060 RepID=UPI00264CD9E5|nr:hypothetical protein [Pseudidiomarina sp. 1ASP75-5]MDN7136017.1 hypothetical protein [Pseudidiomarina sp. 1ASP75-5]
MGTSFFRHLNAQMAGEADKALVEELEFISKKINSLGTEVFLKPSNLSMSGIFDVVPCKKMTMFTYTVSKGFAKIVEDSIDECTGEVRLVFSFTRDSKPREIRAVIERLVEINDQRETGGTLEVLIQNLSHIKFLQRDDHIVYGSANFSLSSDSPDREIDRGRYPSYDELLCESDSGGENVADLMWNFMKKKYPDITPIYIPQNPDKSALNHICDIAFENSLKRYSYGQVCGPVLSRSIDPEKLVDGIFQNLSVDKSFFEGDPDLSYYKNLYSEKFASYLEHVSLQADDSPSDELYDSLDSFVEAEIEEYQAGYTIPELAIESRFDERAEGLFEPTPEDLQCLYEDVVAEVKDEISVREDDFVESFNDKLRGMLRVLILEKIEEH